MLLNFKNKSCNICPSIKYNNIQNIPKTLLSHSCPFYLLYLHSIPLLNLPNHLQFEIPTEIGYFCGSRTRKSLLSAAAKHMAGMQALLVKYGEITTFLHWEVPVETIFLWPLCAVEVSVSMSTPDCLFKSKVPQPKRSLNHLKYSVERGFYSVTYIYWCYSFIIRS